MQTSLTLIPTISIHPGQINLYNEVHWHPHKPHRERTNQRNEIVTHGAEHLINSKRSAQGNVSSIAKRKMTKAVNYMLFVTNDKTVTNQYTGKNFKFKIAFATLTLPSKQIHSDNEIKAKCLNQILIELKKYHHVKNYIWRAEKQRNGNIHFHILVDKFIPHQELRDRWNRIVNKLGYVDTYRNEMQSWHRDGFRVRKNLLRTWPLRKQKSAYERGARTHWNSPNSTDIHSVHKIRDLKSYITKYVTKNEIKEFALRIEKLKELRKNNSGVQNKVPGAKRKELIQKKRNRQLAAKKMKQSGRIWGCNVELSNLKGAQANIDWQINDELEELAANENIKVLEDKYFTIIFFDSSILMKRPESQLFKLFSQFLFDKFGYSIQTEIAA